MRTTFFKSSSPLNSNHVSPTRSPIPSSSPQHHNHHTISESLMEENLEIAQSIITRWDLESHSYETVLTPLFHGDRRDAKEYLKAVNELQGAMHFFVTEHSGSEKLVRAQNLMQIAMKRLEKEFYEIISTNRDSLDSESVSKSSASTARSSVSDFEDGYVFAESEEVSVSDFVMSDLRMIAQCMISSGYAKECLKIYKMMRKSIVDEGLYHLGVEKLNFSQVHKMDWEVLEVKIKHWLHAVKIAVKSIFNGERILCDYVFQSSPAILESCFTEISRDGAMLLFGFPEMIAKCKKSPEKTFRTLDVYESIADLLPEIESIFYFESTSIVRTQAITCLVKLGDAVRIMLTEFESAIQKESSRSAVPGGGVHPLTRYVMNYISFLAEYSGSLADIFADFPITSANSPFPESYCESSFGDCPDSEISVRLAWLVLVLLCKLDGKAELHKDVALSYLFLANNLQYAVVKVRSSNLKLLLGDEWLTKHEAKVKQYASNYERIAWNKVIASLPDSNSPMTEISLEIARDHFTKFNLSFEESYRRQSTWIVPDSKLREDIKISVSKKLVPIYRELYVKFRVRLMTDGGSVVRFAPDDLDNYLSDLFHGNGVSGSTSSSSSFSGSSHYSHVGRSI